ncbi:C39 family peptidase [Ferroacidibacillus organovorans]|nr:C39 family peptidase [Ferroacidibacillus organovorans]
MSTQGFFAKKRRAVREWLLHLGRIYLIVPLLSALIFSLFPSTALTDSPLMLRRQFQLEGAAMGHTDLFSAQGDTGLLLRVTRLRQLPRYQNGCEITSLAMLLRYLHIDVSLPELAHKIARDKTPLTQSPNGAILSWGNPERGFVGSMRGNAPGYGVYHTPIANLLNQLAQKRALDMTGKPFRALLTLLGTGRPVIVWTTIDYTAHVPFITWQSPTGRVRATWQEHVVLLVGYNARDVYVNNPLTGTRQAIPRKTFESSYVAMGRQAITVTSLAQKPAPRRA